MRLGVGRGVSDMKGGFNGLRALESQRNEPSRQSSYGLGATSMDGWTTFREMPEAFKKLAEG